MCQPTTSIGRLAQGTVQDTLIEQTIEFVWDSLLPCRNDPDRPFVEAEEDLNAQFHNFLQSRANAEFPMIFFQPEQRQTGRRKVDLSAKPARSVSIQGVVYNRYRPFLVIEGKRLPAPSKTREREYVSGGEEISGGIQRFKLGLHGRNHSAAIMLGYLQQGEAAQWHSRINGWISELAESQPNEWSCDEMLSELLHPDTYVRARSVSEHIRTIDSTPRAIRILHFWIDVPHPPRVSQELPPNDKQAQS